MNKPDLILIGSGGHSHSCIDAIEQEGNFQIKGLIGVNGEVGSNIFGYQVIATDSDLVELVEKFPFAFIALGQIKHPEKRILQYENCLQFGFTFPKIIAPTAYVSPHATIGAGSIVLHGAVVNAGAIIGENCIVNSGAIIEHDSRVGNHSHISTGAIVNGGTTVGSGCFIGSGATLKEGISVGDGSIVGMGLSVRHNLMASTKFRGEVIS
jgi:sugar O-acyltransferase (sialic acid O-acetyltransferase NeuD family)